MFIIVGSPIHRSSSSSPPSSSSSSSIISKIIIIIDIIWLVVSTPLKNIRQLGLSFPIYAKIKHVPNHQPVIININIWHYNFNPRRSSTNGKVFVDTSQNWMLNDVGGPLVISHEGGCPRQILLGSYPRGLNMLIGATSSCRALDQVLFENNPRNSNMELPFHKWAWHGRGCSHDIASFEFHRIFLRISKPVAVHFARQIK